MEKKENRWKKFGRLLRTARLQIVDKDGEPISINDMAIRADISRVQWSRYENGASGVKASTIPAIARALGRTTDEEINEVFKWAGFYVDEEPFQLPRSMRHFIELPVEIQKDIVRQVERAYEYEQLKRKGRGK